MAMLSAIDGLPGPSVAAMHGSGDHPWLPHLVRGTDCGGTIGSVTSPNRKLQNKCGLRCLSNVCVRGGVYLLSIDRYLF